MGEVIGFRLKKFPICRWDGGSREVKTKY